MGEVLSYSMVREEKTDDGMAMVLAEIKVSETEWDRMRTQMCSVMKKKEMLVMSTVVQSQKQSLACQYGGGSELKFTKISHKTT